MKTAFFLFLFVFMVGASSNAEEAYEEFRLEEGQTVLEIVVRESKAKHDSKFVSVLHPRYDDVKYDVNNPAQMTRLHVGTRIRIDSRLLRPRLVAETISPQIAMNLTPPVVASAIASSIIANEVLDFEPATPRPWYQHNYPADEVAKFLLTVMGTTAAILWSIVIFVLKPPSLFRRYDPSRRQTVLVASAPLQLPSSQPQLLLPPSSNSPPNT